MLIYLWCCVDLLIDLLKYTKDRLQTRVESRSHATAEAQSADM